jgi:hypothetical protein
MGDGMLTLKINLNDFKSLTDKMRNLTNQIPAAAAAALNETGKEVLTSLRNQMTEDFDRPTPYTLNSLYTTKATRNKLAITVLPREWPGKGTPAANYLKPQIYGGDRNMKRFEKALQAKGVMPIGMYAWPSSGATMDAYGNMSTGQIVQILSYFKAFGEQGYRANITDKGRAKLLKGSKRRGFGFEYFAVRRKHGGLVPGIWKRISFGSLGKGVSPILIFGKKPIYKRRYRWAEVANATAGRTFPENFKKALQDL